MTVYIASKSRHWPFWAALRAAGINVRAGWIDAEFNRTAEELSADAWSNHWAMCISEASSADIVLVYARADERQMGALVELGAGLASGAQVYLVSDHEWSVRHHPRVRCFTSLEQATEAIIARDAGEKARAA